MLIWAVSRIQFSKVVGPRSPFSWWLETQGCSLLLEPITFLGSWPPSCLFQASDRRLSPSHVSLALLVRLHLTKERLSLLLQSQVITWIVWDNLPNSRSMTLITPGKSLLPHEIMYSQVCGHLWGPLLCLPTLW